MSNTSEFDEQDITIDDEIIEVDFEAEIAKLKDIALRTRADLDNFRKRALREKEDAIRYANISLLERLLPVVDNFELGLEAAKTTTDSSSILLGMSMVHKQLQEFLKNNDLEEINTEGELFDPNKHEAVSQEYNLNIPEGYIIKQVRKGYKIKDRLVRASSVVVSKGAQE